MNQQREIVWKTYAVMPGLVGDVAMSAPVLRPCCRLDSCECDRVSVSPVGNEVLDEDVPSQSVDSMIPFKRNAAGGVWLQIDSLPLIYSAY